MTKIPKTIQIAAIVDVVGALATKSLEENIYIVDSNKEGGSQEEGTGALKTKVTQGTTLIWTVRPTNVEAFAGISDVKIPEEYCKPEKKYYPNSDIAYWEGTVDKVGEVSYSITLELGTTKIELSSPRPRPGLIVVEPPGAGKGSSSGQNDDTAS